MVELTDAAISRILEQTEKNQLPGIRVGVTGGGCTGWKYLVEPIAEFQEDDQILNYGKFFVVVDELSVNYLRGATIDFIKEGLNQTLKIFNPNEVSACGCGESIMFDTFAANV